MQLTVQWSTTEEHRNVRKLFSSADMPTVWAQMIFPTGDFHCVLLFFWKRKKDHTGKAGRFALFGARSPFFPKNAS